MNDSHATPPAKPAKLDLATKRTNALLFAVNNIRTQTAEVRHFAATAKLLLNQRARVNAEANKADEIANVLQDLANAIHAKNIADQVAAMSEDGEPAANVTWFPSPEGIGETPQPVTVTYTNWRDETADRKILPKGVWYGSTEWHPEPQWLLRAVDVDKGENRDFALKDFGRPAPLSQERARFAEALKERAREVGPLTIEDIDEVLKQDLSQ